jgi:hypothetical protein
VLPDRQVRTRRIAVLCGVAAAGVVIAVALPGSKAAKSATEVVATTVVPFRPATVPATTTRPDPTATTTVVTSTVTPTSRPVPTTVDLGALPQTTQVPDAADPAFAAHVQQLWRAVVDGNPAEALPFFFPIGAYRQIKAISDPDYDYQTRLIPNFDQDVQTIHASLGAGATFAGVTVPDAAQWILPGVEANKGSYWRVYGTRVSYVAGGQAGSFAITSMISWRGQWYVVHLGPIR